MQARCVRAGIARLAAEAALLALSVALALITFTPLGSYVLGGMSRVQAAAGHPMLDVVGINPEKPPPTGLGVTWCGSESEPGLWIFVMNLGPGDLGDVAGWCPSQGNPPNEDAWLVVIDNSSGRYSVKPCAVVAWFDETERYISDDCFYNSLSEGEIWLLYVRGAAQNPTSQFSIEVYGPESTSVKYLHRPG